MENILTNLPFGSWIMAAVIFILGIAAAYYFFDKDRRARRIEEDEAEDRLIKLLKATVEEFEGKLKAQDEKITSLTKKVEELEHDNDKLVEILQGRDGQTQQFYKDAYVAMEKLSRTQDNVKAIHEEMKVLISSLNTFIQHSTPRK